MVGVAGLTVATGAILSSGGEEEVVQQEVYIPSFVEEAQAIEEPLLEVETKEETKFPKYIPVSERKPVTTSTKPATSCHTGYSGCLNPNASDYDCSGGSGNGPYYTGPVKVYGSDPFDLDRDNDGMGCE